MRQNNLIKQEKILRLPSWIKFPISKASELEKIEFFLKNSKRFLNVAEFSINFHEFFCF